MNTENENNNTTNNNTTNNNNTDVNNSVENNSTIETSKVENGVEVNPVEVNPEPTVSVEAIEPTKSKVKTKVKTKIKTVPSIPLVNNEIATPDSVSQTSNMVTVTIDGLVRGTKQVLVGTKLSDAIKEFTSNPSKISFSDKESGSDVSHNTVLSNSINLTSTVKSSGG